MTDWKLSGLLQVDDQPVTVNRSHVVHQNNGGPDEGAGQDSNGNSPPKKHDVISSAALFHAREGVIPELLTAFTRHKQHREVEVSIPQPKRTNQEICRLNENVDSDEMA